MSLYLPRHFRVDDRALLLEFMAAHGFVQLIGSDPSGLPFVTHLPVAVSAEGDGIVIEGHLARANPQGGWLAGRQALAVFNGPNGYVSPDHYASAPAVPTWNYAAVHASGPLALVEDEADKDRLLKTLIARYEPGYAERWRGLDADYRQRMLAGIVGFRIAVTALEGKFKLSQNRSEADRQGVHAAFVRGDPGQRALAAWMEKLGLV